MSTLLHNDTVPAMTVARLREIINEKRAETIKTMNETPDLHKKPCNLLFNLYSELDCYQFSLGIIDGMLKFIDEAVKDEIQRLEGI